MIQRIQSLYLLVASLLTSLLLFLNTALIQTSDNLLFEFTTQKIVNSFNQELLYSQIPLMLLTIILIIFGLYIIFQFKKRAFQKKLSWILLVLHLVLIAAVFYFLGEASKNIPNVVKTTYLFPIVIPFVNVVLVFLAIRGISNDEALIKAVDRIR